MGNKKGNKEECKETNKKKPNFGQIITEISKVKPPKPNTERDKK